MEVRIALFDNEKKIISICYPVKDIEFFDKLVEYADLLRCKEEKKKSKDISSFIGSGPKGVYDALLEERKKERGIGIEELESKNKEMRKCLENVQTWFNNFRYNAYGIAVEDDVEDPEELKREIEIILREERKNA